MNRKEKTKKKKKKIKEEKKKKKEHVGFLVDKMALEQVFLQVLYFSSQYHSTSATHSCLCNRRCTVDILTSSKNVVKRKRDTSIYIRKDNTMVSMCMPVSVSRVVFPVKYSAISHRRSDALST